MPFICSTRPLLILCGASALAIAAGVAARTAPSDYRDLNHNGRLDPYEDNKLPAGRRVEDLLGRMTLAEKAGTMMHGTAPGIGDAVGHSNDGYDLAKARAIIVDNGVTSLITRLSMAPADLAEQNNRLQRLAGQSRLGIPLTISTDPRNHFQAVLGASTRGGGFTLWPETLGLAALGDPSVVRQFGDVARREYRAVGIHMALSPQADLASEPRWPRGTATFGSDPVKVSALVGAYIQGFQHGSAGIARDGVATVVKHWVGYGAEPEGFDAHNYYGRIVRHDDASFARHVAAFDGAFAAHVAGVMPTYPIIAGVTLNGRPLEQVGAGFSRQLLTGLLRGNKKFNGLILSDWGITNDCPTACSAPTRERPQTPAAIAMPWGVEAMTKVDRFAKAVDAGMDQFGGVDDPAPLIAAVAAGKVTPARLDESVRRILMLKFEQGLFDNPYVDASAAATTVGNATDLAAAEAAQRAAQVLLQNRNALIPVRSGRRVWLYGMDAAAARAAGLIVVDDPTKAELALVRVSTPSEKLHPYAFFGSRQNEGRLDFHADDPGYVAILRATAVVPTIVAVDMDRPAILTNIRDCAAAMLAVFGASDAAVLDVVTGKARARGRLPFELPSSMASVARQNPARSDDSASPLFKAGAGIVE